MAPSVVAGAYLPPILRLRFRERFRDDFREGTFAPLRRASLRPIAIACLRLLTLRPDPLFNVPLLRRRIAELTFLDAAFPYLAMCRPPRRSSAKHVREKLAWYALV
jgi:hypothetical protein